MKSANPPCLAAWILQHFGPQVNSDALAGDLWEAFTQGRSKAWYWRQVLAAIRWRGLLYTLLIFAAISWWMTSPDMWRRSPLVSRPLDMAIFMAVFLSCRYLPGMLRGRLRAELAVLIVVFFCWLHRDHGIDSHDIYSHYNMLAFILTYALVFNRKVTAPPHYLTLRELLLGDPFAERKRMIAKLEQLMADETDPVVRHAYAESIAVLLRKGSSVAKAAE